MGSSPSTVREPGLFPRGTPAAVIFDMDGVLVDSNETWDRVMSRLFAIYGKSLSDLDEEAFEGGDNSMQWATFLRRHLQMPLSEEEIVEHVVEGIIAGYSSQVPLIPGAAEAVDRLAGRFPLGLASSSPRDVIAFVLSSSGLERHFRVWVSSDDVDCGKPAPDVYLHCSQLLEVAPEECVAVEDSRFGIRAAKAAGMKVIAIPTPIFPLDKETISLADAVLESIAELTPEVAEATVDARA